MSQEPKVVEAQLKQTNEELRVLNNIRSMIHSYEARGAQAWRACQEADHVMNSLINQAKAKLDALTGVLPKVEEPKEVTPTEAA